MEQMLAAFDPMHWDAICSSASSEAKKRCGSVYEMYVKFFSEEIDQQVAKLPEEFRGRAIGFANDWGYSSPQEREQTQRDLAKQGRCSHGLHPENCPMGCGDLPRSFFADTEAP